MMVAIDRRTYTSRRTRVRYGIIDRPFRALAVVLALVALLMLHGIMTTPTYEQERLAAEARYNAALDLVAAEEAAGRAFVLRPETAPAVGRVEKDAAKLHALREEGYARCAGVVDRLRAFLG